MLDILKPYFAGRHSLNILLLDFNLLLLFFKSLFKLFRFVVFAIVWEKLKNYSNLLTPEYKK